MAGRPLQASLLQQRRYTALKLRAFKECVERITVGGSHQNGSLNLLHRAGRRVQDGFHLLLAAQFEETRTQSHRHHQHGEQDQKNNNANNGRHECGTPNSTTV